MVYFYTESGAEKGNFCSLVRTAVSLLRQNDLAADIASVNNKVSVDLFCCLPLVVVVNMIVKLVNMQKLGHFNLPENYGCQKVLATANQLL